MAGQGFSDPLQVREPHGAAAGDDVPKLRVPGGYQHSTSLLALLRGSLGNKAISARAWQ